MFTDSTPTAGKAEQEQDRICRALVSLIDERGYSEIALEDLLERAEVDRAGFEACFSSLDECFAEVWKAYTQTMAEPLLAAYWAYDSWRDGMRALAWELCRQILADHLRARICMVEVNFGGELVQGTRDLVLGGYVELVHLGSKEEPHGAEVPRAQAEAVVGAVWDRAGRIIMARNFDAVVDDVPELLYLIFLPYLGPEVAQEELRRGREDVARFKRDAP